jgi:inner membrane protein
MRNRMPSPIGHALAGLALSWAGEQAGPAATHRRLTWLPIACVAAAVLPDVDLVHESMHRTVTHSVGFTILIMIIAAGVTGWVTGRVMWRVAIVVGAAHASHILLDWLGTDHFTPAGLQALWPFSREWYISGWDLFLPTERRDPLSMRAIGINARAAVRELAIMGSIAAAAWTLRRTRRSRGRSSARGDRRQPSGAAGDTAGT